MLPDVGIAAQDLCKQQVIGSDVHAQRLVTRVLLHGYWMGAGRLGDYSGQRKGRIPRRFLFQRKTCTAQQS